MTTIAALSVRLGMDASGFSDGVNLARSEVNKVAKIMRDSTPATQKLANEIALLDKTFSASGKQTREYANAIDFLKRKYGELNEAAKTQDGLLSRFKQLATAYVSFQAGKTILSMAADVEMASIQFEVMTGSAERAAQMIDEMKRFAAASPLSLTATQKAGQVLMSFGTAADQVMPKIALLGDITGGNQQRFESLTIAYAQASAAGRLMGQDLLQMVNAGFNPLLEISKMTGKSLVDLKKDMENGLITIDMVDQAFLHATESGGQFNGMTDKMGGTFTGAMSQMTSAIGELGVAIVQPLLPVLTKMARIVESITRHVLAAWEAIGDFGKAIAAGVVAYGSFIVIAMKVIAVYRMIQGALKAVAIAQSVVAVLSGPIGWAALAASVAVAAGAYYGLSAAMDAASASTQEANSQAAEAASALGTEISATSDLGKLAASASAAMDAAVARTEADKKAAEAHQSIVESLELEIAQMTKTSDEYERMVLARKGLNDAQIESIRGMQKELELLKLKKQTEEAFAKEQESAIEAAKRFFADEKRADEERRKRMIEGPKAAEAGSAEAARIIAEQHNRALVARMPQLKEATNEEVVKKAKELMIANQTNLKKQDELMTHMRKATDAMLATRPKLAR